MRQLLRRANVGVAALNTSSSLIRIDASGLHAVWRCGRSGRRRVWIPMSSHLLFLQSWLAFKFCRITGLAASAVRFSGWVGSTAETSNRWKTTGSKRHVRDMGVGCTATRWRTLLSGWHTEGVDVRQLAEVHVTYGHGQSQVVYLLIHQVRRLAWQHWLHCLEIHDEAFHAGHWLGDQSFLEHCWGDGAHPARVPLTIRFLLDVAASWVIGRQVECPWVWRWDGVDRLAARMKAVLGPVLLALVPVQRGPLVEGSVAAIILTHVALVAGWPRTVYPVLKHKIPVITFLSQNVFWQKHKFQ